VYTGDAWGSAPCGADYYYERIFGFDYLGHGSPAYGNPNVYVD
jgi:hypothetical protein